MVWLNERVWQRDYSTILFNVLASDLIKSGFGIGNSLEHVIKFAARVFITVGTVFEVFLYATSPLLTALTVEEEPSL